MNPQQKVNYLDLLSICLFTADDTVVATLTSITAYHMFARPCLLSFLSFCLFSFVCSEKHPTKSAQE